MTTEDMLTALDYHKGDASEPLSIDAATAIGQALEQGERMRVALKKIERWQGEFPPSGHEWENGSPMTYSAAFGSNGERDFMRAVAKEALEVKG